MPILQLSVAERLGLNVSLSTAPLHVLMRYTNPTNGRSIAIGSTSGGHPARETEYFEKMDVTQRQVDRGIYLGVLTKRESIAVMASTVTEWLSDARQPERRCVWAGGNVGLDASTPMTLKADIRLSTHFWPKSAQALQSDC